MYALVTNNEITKLITNPKSMVIGDVRYPAKIFQLWSTSELNDIGIYEVVFDNSNKKDEQWYINTNQSYDFDGNEVTASYGTATPKAHADRNGTDEDGVELNPVVVIEGLKTKLIKDLKLQVSNELAKTDWYITRNTEKSTAIPSAISTHRDAVRTKQAEIETQITNASDTPALETLYTYVNTGTEENRVYERPLGEFPKLES